MARIPPLANRSFIGVAGLPRSGSTLLCQLLAQHPDIDCEGHSSPLCNALMTLRRTVSDDPFMLAQLDIQFEKSYQHLQCGMQGLMQGWYATSDKTVVVDKNRAWLHCVEMLLSVDPQARLLVPIRELGQIYGSIEAQHQKTILLDFIDHLADYDRFGRADQLFAQDKAIGSPLGAIRAVEELPQQVKDRLYFIKFEDLLCNTEKTMNSVYQWLGLPSCHIDAQQLDTRPHESDSHYRYKYLHRQRAVIAPPDIHPVPARIQVRIEQVHSWYYRWFYPDRIKHTSQ